MTLDLPDARIPTESAAAHMVTQIPRTRIDAPVRDVIQSLHGRAFECADVIFVTTVDDRLEGIVRINDLFAGNGAVIGDIM